MLVHLTLTADQIVQDCSQAGLMKTDHQETINRLRNKIEAGSNDFRDFRALGSLLFKLGQYHDCPALFEKARDLSHRNLDKAKASIDLGWTSFWSGNHEQARLQADNALKYLHAEASTPEVFAWRGAAQNIVVHCEWSLERATGEWVLESGTAKEAAQLALSYLNQVSLDSVHFEEKAGAFYDAATIHSLLGKDEECVASAELALRISDDDWERASCLTLIAQTLRANGEFLKALEKIAQAIDYAKLWPALLPKLLLERGLVQRLTDHPADAQQSFSRALVLIDSDLSTIHFQHLRTELYVNLGAACFETGDVRGAREAFSSSLIDLPTTDPYYTIGKVWLGRCLESSEDIEEARACFSEALNLHPDHESRLTALEGLARLTSTPGQYRKAIELFEKLLRLLEKTDPRWNNATLWLAYCYEGLGDRRRAQHGYQVVLASGQSTAIEIRRANEGLQRIGAFTSQKFH